MSTHAAPRLTPIARLFAAGASVAALAACATAPQPTSQAALRPSAIVAEEPSHDNASVYGLYLAGEAALDDGESQDAAFYLSRASAKSPDAGFIKERAFAAALVAGEVDRAASLAASLRPPEPKDEDSIYTLGVLTQATVELAQNHAKEAYALLSASPQGGHSDAILLLKPWAAAMAGDMAAATAPLPETKDRGVRAFGALGRAMLLERAGRQSQAEAAYKDQATKGVLFALADGAFLERHGRAAEAVALYDETLAKDPGDPAIVAARSRAAAGRPAPPQPSLKSGAAQALVGPAALLLEAKQGDAGLAYLRLALRLDPHMDEAWVLVGEALEGAGDSTAARQAYAQVQPNSAEYPTAQDRLAVSLQAIGDKALALDIARAAATKAPDDPQTLVVLADILRDDERYGEAVDVLDKLIAKVGGDAATSWRLYYLRGAALEQAGDWPQAQGDLQQALKLRPDDPEILNFLGFAWADRGENLKQALSLLQKATLLDPQNGAVIDSLGWVHYRLGDYRQAVHELELAAALDAADPEVNDHLGDAYWRVGRRLEARYQWRRVLTLSPDATRRTSVETKLVDGLQASPAPQAQNVGTANPASAVANSGSASASASPH
jgi:tetratricopeptide (TPR) repeat protein